MKKIKNKKILVFLAVIFSFMVISSVSYAGTAENVRGWLWGGSEDDADLDPTNNMNGTDGTSGGVAGVIDGNDTMLYWISMNSEDGGEAVDYGVDIPDSGATATGYAWSENLGWIDFGNNCTTGTPSGIQYKAKACANSLGAQSGVSRSENSLIGWARIVSIADASATENSGGWSGWIRLNGTAQNGNPYGVVVNDDGSIGDSATQLTKMATSFGWSDELGWIDFSRMNIESPTDGECGGLTTTYTAIKNSDGTMKSDITVWPSDGGAFCNEGDADPASPLFPNDDPYWVEWDCLSNNGGNNADPKCIARKNFCTLTPCDAAENICAGEVCDPGCPGFDEIIGTKKCPDLNWQEVRP